MSVTVLPVNPGASRTATLTVAGKTVTLTQEGYAIVPPANEEISYFHTDAIGSVRMITGPTGNVLARYDYLPFGVEWGTTSTFANNVKFGGGERDPETAGGSWGPQDYFGARRLQSQIGRFTSVDSLVPIEKSLMNPQRWNRYSYGLNNPLVFVDPDGRDEIYYDEFGEELLDRRVRLRGKDKYFLVVGSAVYGLESPLKKLSKGEKYTLVPRAEASKTMSEWLSERERGVGEDPASLFTVFRNSKPESKWDFKTQTGPRVLYELGTRTLYPHDYIGNLLWAQVMASHGYAEWFAKAAAGGAQLLFDPQLAGPCLGDDCRDSRAISHGFLLYGQRRR